MPKDYIIEPDIDSVLKTVLPQFAPVDLISLRGWTKDAKVPKSKKLL